MKTVFEAYFPQLDEFAHREVLAGAERPWQPLAGLGPFLRQRLEALAPKARRVGGLAETAPIPRDGMRRFPDPGVQVKEWIELQDAVYIEPAGIWIGVGTVLEPTAIIKGPAIIGAACEVRQGAYIRGNVLTGDRCVIGHCTEIKNTILMNHTECGHFNYLGDSLVGSYVNLGAGSRLANLEFRSPEDKKVENFPALRMADAAGVMKDSGLSKLGAVLGDFVEVGCNAVLCPGVLLGHRSWVYPNLTVRKGAYPPGTMLAPEGRRKPPQ